MSTRVCLMVLGFTAAFVLPSLVTIPVVWYYPLERAWSLEVAPHALAMDFYGRILWGVGGGLVGLGLGHLAALVPALRTPRVVGLLVAWTVTAVLAVSAMHVLTLAHRRPTPISSPPAVGDDPE
jgi:hypothetical protein